MNALWAAVGNHARPNSATYAADPRQRGDRITILFAAVHEFAIGTKRTYLVAPHMSAFEGRADRTFCTAHVCL